MKEQDSIDMDEYKRLKKIEDKILKKIAAIKEFMELNSALIENNKEIKEISEDEIKGLEELLE